MLHQKKLLMACAAACVGVAPHPAFSQTAPTSEGAGDAAATAVEAPAQGGDIIVTARKREERLFDTPQSVTVLSGEELSRLGAVQFRDFANSVPALSFTTAGPGQTQVSLRGVTAGNDIGPTVGIYVDDVPYGSSTAFSNASSLALDVGLFDLNRIEVLRGPQGTLYGASTMGGLLKYVTKRPDPSAFGVEAQAGLSDSHDGGLSYNGAAAINVPLLGERAALRTSGFYSRDGGFIDNVELGDGNVNRARIYGGRADLLLRPVDALTVRLTGFIQDIHRSGSSAADYTLAGDPVDGKLDQRRLLAEPFEQRFRLGSAAIDYDFGPVTLTSISSYQTTKVSFRQDASAVYVPVLAGFGLPLQSVGVDQGRSTDKFTQEVRLGGKAGPIDWLIGGFYTDEQTKNTQQTLQTGLDGQPFPLNLATLSIPSSYKEKAVFGNATWHVTDRFELGGGLRYAANKQSFEQIGSGLLVGSTPKQKTSDDVVTWLGSARYRFSDQLTAYARYATGYRPGGPNFVVNDPVTGDPLAADTFRADSLASYELGLRAQTDDRRFSADLAAYHIEWDDIQVATAAGGVSVIANAGRARIDGGELTLTARPLPSLTASGAFAFQRARLVDASPELGAAKGERLPNVPRFTATASIDWRASKEQNRLRPTAGATLRFVSDRTSSFNANPGFPQYRLPDYTVVDVRAGLSFGPVDAQLFARNLFDERGQLSAATVLSSAGGPAQVSMLQPRTIGLSATTRF